jgi:cytochrome c-type biogenesis protein CcmH/NrfF
MTARPLRTALGIAALAGAVALAVWWIGRPAPLPDAALTRQDARTLAGDIMSPFCPGRTLATCPSPAAADVRVEIERRLTAGESRSAIEEDLIRRFGEDMRGAPKAEGVSLLLWIVPGVFGVTFVGVLAVMLKRRHATTAAVSPAAPSPLPDDVRQRVDDELSELD